MKFVNFHQFVHYLIYKVYDKPLNKPNIANGYIDVQPGRGHWEYKPNKLGKTVVGAVDRRVLISNGDWEPYYGIFEAQQRNGHETMSCASQSVDSWVKTYLTYLLTKEKNETANEEELELLKIFRYFNIIKNNVPNVSGRAVAVLSGTTVRGNNIHNPLEAIRKYGLVPEDMCPWVDGWENYYTIDRKAIIKQGQKILKFINFSHEWVRPDLFTDTLPLGPIITGVPAWGVERDGLFQTPSFDPNHATLLGKIIKTYKQFRDTYLPATKNCVPGYPTTWGKIATISLRQKLNIFNEEEIKTFKKERGKEYILLVDNYDENFDYGVYQLKDNGLEKKEVPDLLNEWVVKQVKDGKLIGVNKETFSNFIN